MSAPVYGINHRGTIEAPGPLPDYWTVRVTALNPQRPLGPLASAVPNLAPGDRVLLSQIGTTRDDLVITGRLPPVGPESILPIDIADVTGLQSALDAAATDTDLAALAATIDARDDGQDATLTDHGTRLTTAEGTLLSHGTRLTTAEGTIISHGTRLTTVEGVNTTQNSRLTTNESAITALQARKSLRIARPDANAPFWTGSQTTVNNTTYVIAQINIADPGWPYFIEGFASFTVSGATGGPYSSSAHMRVDTTANPTTPTTDLIGSTFMRTIDGGFASFQLGGVAQQSWTGAHTVYLLMRNGGTGVMTIGGLSTSLMYRFDLIIHPA